MSKKKGKIHFSLLQELKNTNNFIETPNYITSIKFRNRKKLIELGKESLKNNKNYLSIGEGNIVILKEGKFLKIEKEILRTHINHFKGELKKWESKLQQKIKDHLYLQPLYSMTTKNDPLNIEAY